MTSLVNEGCTIFANIILLNSLYDKFKSRIPRPVMLTILSLVMITSRIGYYDRFDDARHIYFYSIYYLLVWLFLWGFHYGRDVDKLLGVVTSLLLYVIYHSVSLVLAQNNAFDEIVQNDVHEVLSVGELLIIHAFSILLMCLLKDIIDSLNPRASKISSKVTALFIVAKLTIVIQTNRVQFFGTTLFQHYILAYNKYKVNEIYNLILLILVLISLCIFYHSMIVKANEMNEQKIKLQELELKQMHYEETKLLYTETSAWRHDYKNHMQVIRGLADIGDSAKLKAYIAEMKNVNLEFRFRDE
ncbi:MAG: Spo0B domain-containing protein [Suipraeoptans sp.]